jgi:hypothetical protein
MSSDIEGVVTCIRSTGDDQTINGIAGVNCRPGVRQDQTFRLCHDMGIDRSMFHSYHSQHVVQLFAAAIPMPLGAAAPRHRTLTSEYSGLRV